MLTSDDVLEINHVIDLSPAVFAHVTVGAFAVWTKPGADEVTVRSHRWSLVAFSERVRRHQPRNNAVGVG